MESLVYVAATECIGTMNRPLARSLLAAGAASPSKGRGKRSGIPFPLRGRVWVRGGRRSHGRFMEVDYRSAVAHMFRPNSK